jgi:hypothetical protein
MHTKKPLWTAPISPDHIRGVLLGECVKAFVRDGRQVAKAGMQSLLIVHGIDKAPNLPLRVGVGFILVEIHLLTLARLEETLGLCVVVGVAFGRYADLRADAGEPFNRDRAGIRSSPIRMMDQARSGLAYGDRLVKRGEGERRVDGARALPADTAA